MSDLQFAQGHRNRNWENRSAWVYARNRLTNGTGYLLFFESFHVGTSLLHVAYCSTKTVGLVHRLGKCC